MRKPMQPAPRGKPVPIITPRHDEGWFCFDAASVSRPSLTHQVDLRAYWWNGACGCEAFQMKYEPELSRGAKPSDKLRCSHIKAARTYFLDMILPKLAENLDGKPKPPPGVKEYPQQILLMLRAIMDAPASKAALQSRLNELMHLDSVIIGCIEATQTKQQEGK